MNKYVHVINADSFKEIRELKDYDGIYLIFFNDVDFSKIDNFEPLDFKDKNVFIKGIRHTLSNISINKPNELQVGFIKRAKSVYIEDTIFKNINVVCGEVGGSIVGQVDEDLYISSSRIESNVKGDAICGGVAGIAKDVNVKYSTINANVNGRGALGGICGMADTFTKDDETKVIAKTDSKYKEYIKDLAISDNVGYLESERNQKIENMLIEELTKLPTNITEEEINKLYLELKK